MKRKLNIGYVGSDLDAFCRTAKLHRYSDVGINPFQQLAESASLDYSSFVCQNEAFLTAKEGIGESIQYEEANELHYDFKEMFSDMFKGPELSYDLLSTGFLQAVTSAATSFNMAEIISHNPVYCDFRYNSLHCADKDENSTTSEPPPEYVGGDDNSCESNQSCTTVEYISEDVTSLSYDNLSGCVGDLIMFFDEYAPLDTVLNVVEKCMVHPTQEKSPEVYFNQDEAAIFLPSFPVYLDTNNTEVSEWLNCHLLEDDMPVLSDDVETSTSLSSFVKPEKPTRYVTLVLDLDETLVHSMLEHWDDADFTFSILCDMKEQAVYVKRRPHLHWFLEKVAEMFNVVIFTASQSVYAKKLLDILDPEDKFFSQRLYREACTFADGSYTKDLTIIEVDLAKVAIIDNTPQVFRHQVNNGIPIKSWIDDGDDDELLRLLPFLETLAVAQDVRPIIAHKFGN